MKHTTCFYSSLPLTHRPPPRSIYTDDPTYLLYHQSVTNSIIIQLLFMLLLIIIHIITVYLE
uniref:Uncharacterized protein n=1 Tax=Helianthus annuus TaxID=4232 RepID=A0A251S2H0_HELAN